MKANQQMNSTGVIRRGTLPHVLAALEQYSIPRETIMNLRIVTSGFDREEDDRDINVYNGCNHFCKVRYFEGIEQPLFHFDDPRFMMQRFKIDENGKKKPQFSLSLYTHTAPSLVISGEDATPELHKLISKLMLDMLSGTPAGVAYNAGAYFQGGHNEPNGKFIYILFTKPAGAQAFVDCINNNYVVPENT